MTPQTRQAVLSAAEQLGYRPNLVARSLRTYETLTIGILVENMLSPFNPPIIQGIQEILDQHNYLSLTINAKWDPTIELEAIRTLAERQIDGIILVESYIRASEEIARLSDRPHVFVHRLFDSLTSRSVVPDDQLGGRLAVQHLVDLGHRRIGFVSGPGNWDASANRLRGYKDVLEAAGIPFDPELVRPGDWGGRSGYDAAKRLLSCDNPPTAIFAANDLMALGVIYAASDMGRRVPEDLAVVGYDDRDFAGYVRPGITTVQMPCVEMGRRSAHLLLDLINCENANPDAILVPGRLVVRQSCGAATDPWDFEPERASLTRRRQTYTPEESSTDGIPK
jgi:DNA-binding LacI/PurR family transcriptional regulator